jgi:hypothetical protein
MLRFYREDEALMEDNVDALNVSGLSHEEEILNNIVST